MRVIGVLIVLVALAPQPAQADMPAAWFGTWSVDFAKSSAPSGPPPFKRITCTIAPAPGGFKVAYDMVGTRGGVTHLEWMGNDDGADYAVEGVDAVLTNAYRRIDERTYSVVQKVDGATVATAVMVIAADGSTITTRTAGANAQGDRAETTTVYERTR
jgi:hypothetical protein